MLTNIFIFIIMVFFHIHDDFNRQGILATMKQKKYWEENYPAKMYKNDYIMALLAHSFAWVFMILLPPTMYVYFVDKSNFNSYLGIYMMMFISNWILHALVDDLKANKLVINLVQDQLIHIFQILLTCIVLLSTLYF